jgi:ATP-binding cassette, subfamily B, bacterial CvaB/MchF/RaxB
VFSIRNKLSMIHQAERSECGLACLTMIAKYYGNDINLSSIRCHYPSVGGSGTRLKDLIDIANSLGFSTRAIRAELEEISQLKLPCIIHWELNHFVVLAKLNKNGALIHDPAKGKRVVDWKELNTCFTGIVLELSPSVGFKKLQGKKQIKLRDLLFSIPNIRAFLFQLAFISLVLEILAIAAPLLTQVIIDTVFLTSDKELLVTIIIGVVFVLVLNVVLSSVRDWCVLTLSVSVNLHWLDRLFGHLTALPIPFFEKRGVGDISSRFNSATTIQQTLTSYFVESLLDSVMAIGTFIFMLLYSFKLTIVTLGGLIIYSGLKFAWYGYLRQKTEESLFISAKEDGYFIETLRGIQSIRLFQRTAERKNIWMNMIVEQSNVSVELEKARIAYQALNVAIVGVEQSIILWFGANLVFNNYFSIGMFMAFASYSTQFSSKITNLVNNVLSLKMIRLHLDRVSDIILSSADGLDRNQLITKEFVPEIEFRRVYFKYDDSSDWLLENISFKISQGEVVALVGPSGCGKSTILKLALGIHKPVKGDIFVSGIPLNELHFGFVRNNIASVLQEDFIFSGSIFDNIAFMDPNPNVERVYECAKQACIYDDVVRFPMGFNTGFGDIGVTLSSGQQQRVLFARALYTKSQLLLLDEATSHLDNKTEHRMNKIIRGLGLTILMVAHRSETINSATRVISLSHQGQLCNLAHDEESVADRLLSENGLCIW